MRKPYSIRSEDHTRDLARQNSRLQTENADLKKTIAGLQIQVADLNQNYLKIQEEFETLKKKKTKKSASNEVDSSSTPITGIEDAT